MNEENSINNTINDVLSNSTNETIENIIIPDTNIVTLDTIHNDLGFICTFLCMAAILVFCRIIYKAFNLFF